MADGFTFGSPTARPGTKTFGWLDVAILANGGPLRIPVHVVSGRRPGPRLTVISTQHGYEITEIEVCHELVAKTEPDQLRGTLVVVPVANPLAFEWASRTTWIDGLYGDNGNMNRVWPGRPNGWITERMVYLMGEHLIKGSDVVIDLHDGAPAPPGLIIYYGYSFAVSDPELTRRVRELALASGFDILIKRAVTTLTGSLGTFALNEKIPVFVAEVGRFYGFQLNGEKPPAEPVRTIPECGITAVRNIMKHLGMLEGEPVLPARQLLVSPENNLRPIHGGVLYSNIKADGIGRVVPKNALLGTVMSPYTFEILDEVRPPYDQNMIIATTYLHPFARVNPGDHVYIVADMSTAEWIER
ncbi:MAG: succinylglutamate desuccinylase/aspartoacylase family protein [Chloroflexi bacterium]|nr:succinylglutamate desuccinylase/aspartoacylase family protein [Chloroflexota bacterium]